MSTHGEAAGHAAGHGPHRNYVKIWAVLMVLLVVSIVGPFAGIRVITLATAFGVALVKAYIVAKNFMHLDIEKPIVHWLLIVTLLLMVLLFAGLSPDVMKHEGRNWKKDKPSHPAEKVDHPSGDPKHGAQGH